LLLLGLLGVTRHGWRLLGEGLGFFYEHRPVFGDREFAVEGWRAFAGFHADGDSELTFCAATVDPMGWRHVGVVAADGGADMPIAGDEIIGRVEADPAKFREEGLDPGVGGGAFGAIRMGVAVV
jgi:hypothetical protein